jgi:hypothetical protein
VLPVLVLLVFALTAGVMAAAAQIRCIDAAQAGVRAAARGEPEAVALGAAKAAAPSGARTELTVRDGMVRLRVATDIALPGLWSGWRIPIGHTAVAADEAVPP